MTLDHGTSTTRRTVLAAALGGLGGFIASAVGRPARVTADTGDNFVLGNPNTADATTELTSDNTDAALSITASSDAATAVKVTAAFVGVDSAGTIGVAGTTEGDADSIGVHGAAVDGLGVLAESTNSAGIVAAGFWGLYAFGAIGVTGDVDGGCGVQGWSGTAEAPLPTAQTGVWAGATKGRTALQVQGVARFSRAGRVAFSSGQASKQVPVPGGLGVGSFALAVLNTNRSGIYVRAVVPNASTDKITIYLNKAVPGTTQCAWMVLA